MKRILSSIRRGWNAKANPGEELSETLTLSGNEEDREIPFTARIAGPEAVRSLQTAAIRRRLPASGAREHQADVFPMVEFREPDLLWRYSPAPSGDGPVLPWLVLVVMERTETQKVETRSEYTELVCPGSELPEPADAHLWAHALVDEEDGVLVTDRGLCRILCPRVMSPDTTYLAALVPLFERGRRAGLHLAFDGNIEAGAFAWSTSAASVTLPVFDSWTFHTVPALDLEQLVERLKPASRQLGWREVHLPAQEGIHDGGSVMFPGALTAGIAELAAPPQIRTDLETILHTTSSTVPEIGPPTRGTTFGGSDLAGEAWFGDLNLEPAWRAAAGLGEEVVRQKQELYVVDAIDAIEAQKHMRVSQRKRTTSHLVSRKVKGITVSSTWADLLSSARLEGMDPPVEPKTEPVGIDTGVPSFAFWGAVRRRRRRGLAWRRRRRWNWWRSWRMSIWAGHAPHLFAPKPWLARTTAADPPDETAEADLEQALAWWALEALDTLDGAQSDQFDSLYETERPEPVPIARSLFEALLEVEPEGGLPGLTGVGRERAALLHPQDDFVEAFLVGANEEMRRELLWRELPKGDGSLLRRFWSGTEDDLLTETFDGNQPLGVRIAVRN